MIALLASASVCAMSVSSAMAEVPAQGQSQSQASGWNWDWGGEKKEVASSGKTVVTINSQLKPGEIFVSFSDRRLYFITKPGEAWSYPIAIPREQDDWKGMMIISDKKINPSWTPTPTMIKENPRLPSWVPGGHPYNPLGVRALYLGSSAYRIHGTDAPWTIGEPVSKGCIRMYNKDVVDLYEKVKLGTRVTVTWDSFNGGPVRKPYGNAVTAAATDDKSQRREPVAAARPDASRERLYERSEREAAEKPRSVAATAAPVVAPAAVKETKEQARERERLEKLDRERAEKAERDAAKEAARERNRGLGSIFSGEDPQETWVAPQDRTPRTKQAVQRRVSAATQPRAAEPGQ